MLSLGTAVLLPHPASGSGAALAFTHASGGTLKFLAEKFEVLYEKVELLAEKFARSGKELIAIRQGTRSIPGVIAVVSLCDFAGMLAAARRRQRTPGGNDCTHAHCAAGTRRPSTGLSGSAGGCVSSSSQRHAHLPRQQPLHQPLLLLAQRSTVCNRLVNFLLDNIE